MYASVFTLTNEITDDEVFDFEDMNLPENILRGIYAYGFEKPSSLQRVAIPPYIRGRDLVIAPCRTGVGNTASYIIGILARLDYGKRKCQALVLVPTRELAQATAHV